MPKRSNAKIKTADSTANLGFEAKLWLAADKLRNNMDAARINSSTFPTDHHAASLTR
jgi:hypothetical protein